MKVGKESEKNGSARDEERALMAQSSKSCLQHAAMMSSFWELVPPKMLRSDLEMDLQSTEEPLRIAFYVSGHGKTDKLVMLTGSFI